MENEFYVIQEEFFDEDANRSSYEPLNDLVFASKQVAIDYLMSYVEQNSFDSIVDESDEEDCSFLVKDENFNCKYDEEGCSKRFDINKLMLFK